MCKSMKMQLYEIPVEGSLRFIGDLEASLDYIKENDMDSFHLVTVQAHVRGFKESEYGSVTTLTRVCHIHSSDRLDLLISANAPHCDRKTMYARLLIHEGTHAYQYFTDGVIKFFKNYIKNRRATILHEELDALNKEFAFLKKVGYNPHPRELTLDGIFRNLKLDSENMLWTIEGFDDASKY